MEEEEEDDIDDDEDFRDAKTTPGKEDAVEVEIAKEANENNVPSAAKAQDDGFVSPNTRKDRRRAERAKEKQLAKEKGEEEKLERLPREGSSKRKSEKSPSKSPRTESADRRNTRARTGNLTLGVKEPKERAQSTGLPLPKVKKTANSK